MPLTQFSGTGFAGIETSLMTEPAGGEARKSGTPGSRRIPRLLNVPEFPPISLSCRPLPVVQKRIIRLHTDESPARLAGGFFTCRSMED